MMFTRHQDYKQNLKIKETERKKKETVSDDIPGANPGQTEPFPLGELISYLEAHQILNLLQQPHHLKTNSKSGTGTK